jgi:hypothetical protein
MPTLILASRPCGAAYAGLPARASLPVAARQGTGRSDAGAGGPAPAGGPTPDVDDANTRATGPASSPRPSASAGSACGDRVRHAARPVRSWPPRAGRESDSPGSTPPHARCHSYGTGRRRLSLGSRPRKWPASAGNEKLRTFSTAATCRRCSCQGPEQHPKHYRPAASEDSASPTQAIKPVPKAAARSKRSHATGCPGRLLDAAQVPPLRQQRPPPQRHALWMIPRR